VKKIFFLHIMIYAVLTGSVKAQNSFSWNCSRDTIINCAQQCITLKAKIPNIHNSSSTYSVNATSANGCFRQYVSPGAPGTSTNLTIDDRYSSVITLPFNFNFFGSLYTQLVASTNGYVCFDITKAGAFSHYGILNSGSSLSATTGTPQNLPSTLYDKGLIMGPYHDLDPSTGTNPPATMRIKYDVTGTAPHRRWILSFNTVPLFQAACNSLNQNTHQIVLYESLNVVEVFINTKQQCATWNQARGMVGMQNFTQNAAIMAPGRQASDPAWGPINMNESWRFTPASGPTTYFKCELFDMAGNLVSNGDTTNAGNNIFDVSFENVCPPLTGATSYVVKSTYLVGSTPIIATDTIRAIRGSGLTATTTTIPASCANNNTGSITVNVSGAPGPYEYSINNGATWQASNVFNQPAGTYTIMFRVVGSTCSSSTTATIATGPGNVTATYAITNVRCNGGTDGAIIITPVGGTAPYQYSSNGGVSFQNSNAFTLGAGTYNIVVKDVNNCSHSGTATITQPAVLAATVTTANATCSATPNGVITVSTATGGVSPYTYSIDGTNFQSSNTFNVNPGSYTVTVKDANACTKTYSVQVGLTNNLVLTTRNDTTICQNVGVQMNTTANVGASFNWSPTTGLSNPNIASPIASPLVTTTYQVTATLGVCSKQAAVTITVYPQPQVNAGPDVSIVSGDEIQLSGTAANVINYLWTPSTGLNATNILNPLAKPAVTTLYKLTVTNTVGCSANDDVLVTVIPYCIKVKNAFSPNGDGINDKWMVYDQFACLKNVTVHVFNRYGSKVFESRDYRNTWDGTYKGNPLPDGTYYAVVDFLLINGKGLQIKTDLTILR
jgi:gliding motility-associated-like protein